MKKKFSRWSILREVEKRGYRRVMLCRCDCGTEKEVLYQNLTGGKSRSCGCLVTDMFWKGYEEIPSSYWTRLKNDAKQRQLEFEIRIEDAWQVFIKQNKRCALTGLPLGFGRGRLWYRETTASVDRIDSNKQYTTDNIQWVHKDINRIKSNFSEQQLLKYCLLIVRFKLHEQIKSSNGPTIDRVFRTFGYNFVYMEARITQISKI